MKVAIIGSRNINHPVDLSRYIPQSTTTIISGGAKGVDSLAASHAKDNGIELVVFRPDYAKYGKGATFIRNRQIIDNADMVLAFWDGESKGTKYTIEYAIKKGKETQVIRI